MKKYQGVVKVPLVYKQIIDRDCDSSLGYVDHTNLLNLRSELVDIVDRDTDFEK